MTEREQVLASFQKFVDETPIEQLKEYYDNLLYEDTDIFNDKIEMINKKLFK